MAGAGNSGGAKWRVFVSHTSELRDFPAGASYVEAVERAISACGHVIVDMADFPSADRSPAELCRERVRSCDVYVAVLGASWETVKAAVPASSDGASVLFIADSISLSSPDHPILVVDLSDTFLSVAEFPEIAGRTPFRCIPSELWSVDNNLNIANMDWEEFAGAAGEDGVFRGFGQ